MEIIRKVIDEVVFVGIRGPSTDYDRLLFNVKTYSKLRYTQGLDNWDSTYSLPNGFLNLLTPDEEKDMLDIFVDSFESLGAITRKEELVVYKERISNKLMFTFRNHQLKNKLMGFVERQRHLFPDFKEIGMSIHHASNKTFNEEEYAELMAISIICKLLSPIFGSIVEFVSNSEMDNKLKELQPVAILAKWLNMDFPVITEKILNYIKLFVVVKNNDPNDQTKTYHGFVDTFLISQTYAMLLIKNFVNVDILAGKSIAGNMHSLVSKRTANVVTSYKKNAVVNTRIRPNDKLDDSGSNSSFLETESFVTAKSISTPILVEFIIDGTVSRMLDEFNLDKDVFERSIKYYKDSPFQISPLNRYLGSTFYGGRLLGAKGISMVNFDYDVKMITFLQMYLCELCKDHPDKIEEQLINALTIAPVNIKTEINPVDQRIANIGVTCEEYRLCEAVFPYAVGNLSWSTALTDVANYLVEKNYTNNTAQPIIDHYGLKCENNRPFIYDEKIIVSLFAFIYHTLKLEKMRRLDLCT